MGPNLVQSVNVMTQVHKYGPKLGAISQCNDTGAHCDYVTPSDWISGDDLESITPLSEEVPHRYNRLQVVNAGGTPYL